MSAFERALILEPNSDAALRVEDRRSNDRAKLLKPVQIHLADATEALEVGTLMDLSRDGLYFTASSDQYRVGMQVRLTLVNTGAECTCEIARIEELRQGRIGIGARILTW